MFYCMFYFTCDRSLSFYSRFGFSSIHRQYSTTESDRHDELERRDVTVAAAAGAGAQSKSVAKRHEAAGSLDDPWRRKARRGGRASRRCNASTDEDVI